MEHIMKLLAVLSLALVGCVMADPGYGGYGHHGYGGYGHHGYYGKRSAEPTAVAEADADAAPGYGYGYGHGYGHGYGYGGYGHHGYGGYGHHGYYGKREAEATAVAEPTADAAPGYG